MGCYLQADIYRKVSFVSRIKGNTNKQNNGHKHEVYFRTINFKLSHLGARLTFRFTSVLK